jgi:uncharacterized CHY-type Zn-finger protein
LRKKFTKACQSCNLTKTNTTWYAGPTCNTCYSRRSETKLRKQLRSPRTAVCSVCNKSKTVKEWRAGDVCSACRGQAVRRANPEAARKKSLTQRWGNIDKRRESGRKSATKAGPRYACLKKAAKNTGLPLEITPAQHSARLSSPCSYCAGPLNPTGHGLDKLDPAGPYSEANCTPACGDCNALKLDRLSPYETWRLADLLREIRGTETAWAGIPRRGKYGPAK